MALEYKKISDLTALGNPAGSELVEVERVTGSNRSRQSTVEDINLPPSHWPAAAAVTGAELVTIEQGGDQVQGNIEDINLPPSHWPAAAAVTGAELVTIEQGGDQVQETLDALAAFICPPGSILPFAGTVAPTGFLMCDNSAVSRTTYARLFAIIGTTFGVGDGATTFNLPDTRGVFIRGAGTSAKLTNANGAAFAGILGTYQNDKAQGHWHEMYYRTAGANGYNVQTTAGTPNTAPYTHDSNEWYQARNPTTDGSNGTPRTGTETNPANLGLNHIIKY